MKDLRPNILDDYEHRINGLIEHHGDEAAFPKMQDYKVTREALDDYLFNYQAILDSEGSQKSQLTIYGIIAVVPILIVSAIPEEFLPWKGDWTLFISIGLGLLLAGLLKSIRLLIKQGQLKSLRREYAEVAQYVDAVDNYLMK